ncbi:hypothetical protein AVEN_99098-1 [Araneus ventricosus]|uniref:Uncharacterized protein n=1 Tax=Araneus ventricosus TaxID=182803 RepID=A0A4Y2K530_ARAVE|nr:hypothetical protein AVEN_99098-1 [Araneus ventricosus]
MIHIHAYFLDRGGLEVRSRLGDEGFQVRNPIPLKIHPVCGSVACQIRRESNALPLVGWRRKLGGGCQLSCGPRHLTVAQIYEIRPKIALVLLQKGRGGLVVGSRPRDQRVAGSKPDSTEDPPCMGPVAR